jgi:hypothetical protein
VLVRSDVVGLMDSWFYETVFLLAALGGTYSYSSWRNEMIHTYTDRRVQTKSEKLIALPQLYIKPFGVKKSHEISDLVDDDPNEKCPEGLVRREMEAR